MQVTTYILLVGSKRSVLRRQSRDRNRNIKRSVYCQYGQYGLTFRALALRQALSDEGPMLETLDYYWQYTDLFILVGVLCRKWETFGSHYQLLVQSDSSVINSSWQFSQISEFLMHQTMIENSSTDPFFAGAHCHNRFTGTPTNNNYENTHLILEEARGR